MVRGHLCLLRLAGDAGFVPTAASPAGEGTALVLSATTPPPTGSRLFWSPVLRHGHRFHRGDTAASTPAASRRTRASGAGCVGNILLAGHVACGTACGSSFTWCAVTLQGLNYAGQLGDGSTTQRNAPTPVAGNATWSMLATGQAHTCGLRSDARLFCWVGSAARASVCLFPPYLYVPQQPASAQAHALTLAPSSLHRGCRGTMATARLVMVLQPTGPCPRWSTLTAGGLLSPRAITTPAASALEASCGVGV